MAKGCHVVRLWSSAGRTEAHRFYERIGTRASRRSIRSRRRWTRPARTISLISSLESTLLARSAESARRGPDCWYDAVSLEHTLSYSFNPIGLVRTPFTDPAQIPKGLGAEHRKAGVIEVDEVFEAGLADIEGFSHLYVIWVFDRVHGVELTAYPPADDLPHGVFATRSPQRPNPIGLTVVELLGRAGRRLGCQVSTCWIARRSSTSSRTSERAAGHAAPRMARRRGGTPRPGPKLTVDIFPYRNV